MGRGYFQFRQFTVCHDRCAMKVGTDGTLLGAWARGGRRVLDVGTGTGLIALMMAQRYPAAEVLAIDIDAAAAQQAAENVAASPFAQRIRVIQGDVRLNSQFSINFVDFCHDSAKQASLMALAAPKVPNSQFSINFVDFCHDSAKQASLMALAAPKVPNSQLFDSIVCNPPFFADSLQCPDRQRSLARHADTLTYADLMAIAQQLLTDDGELSVIVPFDSKSRLVSEAALAGLFLMRECAVSTTPEKAPRRYLMAFGRHSSDELERCAEVLELAPGLRSEWYSELTKDFYIK